MQKQEIKGEQPDYRGKIDIHHQKRNLMRALNRIQNDKNICSENKKLIIV